MKKFSLLFLLSTLLFASCIQDEAPNAEADIEQIIVDKDILLRQPDIENDKITIIVKSNTELRSQKPEFILTPGATISPASGTERDFSTPQTYIVTSQDEQWQKTYTVAYQFNGITTDYHFENSYLVDDKYYAFKEQDDTGTWVDLASGNSGFAITASNKPPHDFPTYVEENGVIGNCLALQTRDTGFLGQLFKSPIAAGNLFNGVFELNLSDPAASTHFGRPFFHVPLALRGYYKYTEGAQYYEGKDKTPVDKQDYWDIYGVLYEVDENTQYLDGNNIFTSPNIVSIARLPQEKRVEAQEWTLFDIPFKLLPEKQIDMEGLKQGKYNLAIVMTSSEEGAIFNGAVDSKLLVDEMTIIYNETE